MKVFLSFFALMIAVGCQHRDSSDKNSESAASKTKEVSRCVAIINGKTSRCMEYDHAKVDSKVLAAAESSCGNQDLKGFVWESGACEEAGRIGECVESSQAYHNYFYEPTYTKENATSICADWGGTFE